MALVAIFVFSSGRATRVADLVTINRIVRTFESEQATPWHIDRRAELWRTALGAAAERPLWGAGPRALATGNALSGAASEPDPPDNTHNYYLQLGAEYGLPALALFLVLLVGVTTRMLAGLAGPGARSQLPWILAAHLGIAAICVISHPLLLSEIQGSYWMLLALGVSIAPSGQPPEPAATGQGGGRELE